MSKIVSPYPPFTGHIELTANHAWWRFRLVPNEDDHTMVMRSGVMRSMAMRSDASGTWCSSDTWCSCEFFDGEDTIIDTGLDRPTAKVRIYRCGLDNYLDVLHDGPPTPSPQWKQLTVCGDYIHPWP